MLFWFHQSSREITRKTFDAVLTEFFSPGYGLDHTGFDAFKKIPVFLVSSESAIQQVFIGFIRYHPYGDIRMAGSRQSDHSSSKRLSIPAAYTTKHQTTIPVSCFLNTIFHEENTI